MISFNAQNDSMRQVLLLCPLSQVRKLRYRDENVSLLSQLALVNRNWTPNIMVPESRLLTAILLHCIFFQHFPPTSNLYLPVCSSLPFLLQFTTLSGLTSNGYQIFHLPHPDSHVLTFPPPQLQFHGQSLHLRPCTRPLPPFHFVSLRG